MPQLMALVLLVLLHACFAAVWEHPDVVLAAAWAAWAAAAVVVVTQALGEHASSQLAAW